MREETARPAASSAGLTILEPELKRAKERLRAVLLACRLFAETCAAVFVLMTMFVFPFEVLCCEVGRRYRMTVGNSFCLFAIELGRNGAAGLRGQAVALLNFVVDFLAVNRDVRRGFNAELHNVAIQPNDFNFDPSVYDDAFTNFAG